MCGVSKRLLAHCHCGQHHRQEHKQVAAGALRGERVYV